MKHYSDKELDEKIESFLSKKLQKYPELSDGHGAAVTHTEPRFSNRIVRSLTAVRPLAN